MKTTESGNRLLSGTIMGLELTWRFAWSNFLALLILQAAYPWTGVFGAFAGAGLVTAVSRGRGWRLIWLVLLHSAGFGLAALHLVHHFHFGGTPFFDSGWLTGFLGGELSTKDRWTAAGEIALVWWLWRGGVRWIKGGTGYQTVSNRFDLGLTAFFVLFIVKALLHGRFDKVVHDPAALPLVVSFFCFGLMSLALARTQGRVEKKFRPGFHGVGTVLSLALAALILAGGAVAFFLPQLTAAAEAGYGVAKAAGSAMEPWLVAFLRLLFGPRDFRQDQAGGGAVNRTMETGKPGQWPYWLEIAARVAGWVLLSLLALAFLCLLFYLGYSLYLKLMSRTARADRPTGLLAEMYAWLDRQFFRLAAFLRGLFEHRAEALAGYLRLLGWGRRSGVPRRMSETPREYGRRLGRYFPVLRNDIAAIVEYLESFVYAERPGREDELAAVRKSLRRLRRPGFWPRRVKVWFIADRKP